MEDILTFVTFLSTLHKHSSKTASGTSLWKQIALDGYLKEPLGSKSELFIWTSLTGPSQPSSSQKNKAYASLSISTAAQAINSNAKHSLPKLHGKNNDVTLASSTVSNGKSAAYNKLREISKQKHIFLGTNIIEISFWEKHRRF